MIGPLPTRGLVMAVELYLLCSNEGAPILEKAFGSIQTVSSQCSYYLILETAYFRNFTKATFSDVGCRGTIIANNSDTPAMPAPAMKT